MKRIFLSLMMFCGASSLCHAQEVKFEYDEAGNLIKKKSLEKTENYKLDDRYSLKVTPIPTNGPMNIKLCETSSNSIVNCRIQVIIHPIAGTGTAPFNYTSEKGNFDINISSLPKDYYALVVLAYVNPYEAPLQTTIKFEKK